MQKKPKIFFGLFCRLSIRLIHGRTKKSDLCTSLFSYDFTASQKSKTRIMVPTLFQLSKSKMKSVQGVTVYSGKSLSSKIGENQCLYWSKRYLSRKPLISAFICHPKSGCGITMELSRPLAVEKLFLPRAHLCFSRPEGVTASW